MGPKRILPQIVEGESDLELSGDKVAQSWTDEISEENISSFKDQPAGGAHLWRQAQKHSKEAENIL